MPFGVILPRMRLQERVLVLSARLGLAPIAFEDVLAGVDKSSRSFDGRLVQRVGGHELILSRTRWQTRRNHGVPDCRRAAQSVAAVAEDPIGNRLFVRTLLEPYRLRPTVPSTVRAR